MKKFVVIVGYTVGVLCAVMGIVAIIIGCKTIGENPELAKIEWVSIAAGALEIVSGVFLCGLIWFLTEHEKRLVRIEDTLRLDEIKEDPHYAKSSKDRYRKDENGDWQLIPTDPNDPYDE